MIYNAESTEAAILISTLDDAEVVNASSTVDLLCIAYGSTSAPSIEWMSITNGKTAIINNSTYSQRVMIIVVIDIIMSSSIILQPCPQTLPSHSMQP